MSDDVYNTFKEMKEEAKRKREHNRKFSTAVLINKGVKFRSCNNGYHLIIYRGGETINFWPSTGLWNTSEGKRMRGITPLLEYLGKQ